MSTCFCGCGRDVPFGRKRATNAVGAQLSLDLRMIRGAQERAPEVVSDPSIAGLLSDGDGLRDQLAARIHDQVTSDDLDKRQMRDVLDRMKPLRNAMDAWAQKLEGPGMLELHNARIALLGTQAQARLVSVQDTGSSINDNPRVKLTFEVRPEDGEPFQVQVKRTVSRVAIPRAGARFPVTYDPDEPEQLVYDPAALDAALTAADAPAPDVATQLATLTSLHQAGSLGDEEFAEAKARVLAGG